MAFAAATRAFAFFKRHYVAIQIGSGAVLIAMGYLVLTGQLFVLNIQAQQLLGNLGLDFFQGPMSRLMTVSHRTIKLGVGSHRSPEDGACVMELASMLANEPFSDHPEHVCPVIAGFLRSYNDHVGPGPRQDLYRYAARVVGTRAEAATERERARLCLRWARLTWDTPPLRVRILHRLFRCQGPDVDGVYAARASPQRIRQT